jgi:hypothetical protein
MDGAAGSAAAGSAAAVAVARSHAETRGGAFLYLHANEALEELQYIRGHSLAGK